MASVNDLAKEMRDAEWRDRVDGDFVASEIETLARESWHPVSEPPTEADGDANTLVAVYVPADEESPAAIMVWPWGDIARAADEPNEGVLWARIRDIVLMPPEGEG